MKKTNKQQHSVKQQLQLFYWNITTGLVIDDTQQSIGGHFVEVTRSIAYYGRWSSQLYDL